MKTAKTTSQKIREVNIDVRSLDTWQDKLKYVVVQRNRIIFEQLSGMALSDSDQVTCSEVDYFYKPTSKMAFKAAIKSIH